MKISKKRPVMLEYSFINVKCVSFTTTLVIKKRSQYFIWSFISHFYNAKMKNFIKTIMFSTFLYMFH